MFYTRPLQVAVFLQDPVATHLLQLPKTVVSEARIKLNIYRLGKTLGYQPTKQLHPPPASDTYFRYLHLIPTFDTYI